MPNNTKISDLELATQLNEADLLLVSQQESESESEEFDSKKTTVGNLAEKVATEVQFSGLQTEDKTITGAINEAAAVGKISDYYHIESFSGYHWQDSRTTVDGHTVYQSNWTYEEISGDDLGTWTIGGYEDVTFFIKQDGTDTSKAYTVLGKPNTEIDLADSSSYQVSYQNQVLSDYTSYKFENLNGETNTFQILYHTDPNDPVGTATVDLTDSQFVDTGTTIDGHTVYMSNAASKCKIKIQGTSSFKIYYKPYTSNSSNRIYIGKLDTPVSSSEYETYDWGQSNYYYNCEFSCSKNEEHYVEVMFNKSVYSESDCVYFYVVLNGDPHTTRGYVYVVPGQIVPSTYRGEVFNDYENNFALGQYSHAEGQSTQATGFGSHTEGYKTIAQGSQSHAEGSNNTANGGYSHAEGQDNIAQGTNSHVEGARNVAGGQNAHAEGMDNETGEQCAHAEGTNTKALGAQSHAEGWGTLAQGHNSHAEGKETQALGLRSHAEGVKSIASGDTSHAEGWATQAKGGQDHSEGYHTIAEGGQSHAEGYYTHATGGNSHTEGYYTLTSGFCSHAEGYYTTASDDSAHAEGKYTDATGEGSHAEGLGTNDTHNIASGDGSHVEGGFTSATAHFAHAEGYYTEASGNFAHAEGFGSNSTHNIASGDGSHTEGSQNEASGNYSHAEGQFSHAIGQESHAEGGGTYAHGNWSHSEGAGNHAYAPYSHAEGAGTETFGVFSHIEGAGSVILGNYGHMEGAGNASTGSAHNTHTEGGGNFNYSVQGHVEGSGNTISGEESHGEGAGNQVHGAKNHSEGGGNAVYGVGSHVEGKHNSIAGFAVHAEGSDNLIGSSTSISQFDYEIDYNVGDIVGPNANYVDFNESNSQYLYRCITAPGKIQEGNGVEFVTASSWSSSVDYPANSVVYFWAQKGCGYFYCSSAVSAQNVPPPVNGSGWTRIGTLLSPFKSGTYSGYCLIRADQELYSGISVAKVAPNTSIEAMWEPIPTPHSSHVEGLGNISTGDYQHVQGKYNTADSNKAFIIGNGTKDSNNVITRSNALTVDWNGNMVLAGDITPGTSLNTTATTIGGAINEIVARIPAPPSVDGTYTLSVTVSNGVSTYSWV